MAEDTANGGNADVSTAAPPQETTMSVASSTLTPPGPPQPAPVRPAMQPAAPPPHENRPTVSWAESVRHALIGSTIGQMAAKGVKAVAGPPPTDYSVDANGRTVSTPRTDTTTSRIERIAQSALLGLAAGSQMPPQKSRGAAWGAGIGAGSQAAMQQGQQQDLQKRQQAQEDYETQQRTLTDKAVRAAHNASTYSLWQKAMDEQNDHDPERQKNMDVVNAIKDYNERNPGSGLQVQIVSPEAAMSVRETDKHSVGVHTFLPLGMTQAKDANGNPVFEQDGVTPKQTGQIAVISGKGNIPLPQSFVDDLKEYGKLAGIARADELKAGQEIPLSAYLNADKRMNDVKLKEIDGWKNAKDVTLSDGKTPGQFNPVTSKTRPYPGGVVPLSVKKEQADISEKESAAKKNLAEADAKAREGISTNEDRALIAEAVRKGRMDPSQLSKRSKDYNAVLAEADKQEMEETGQHFNIAQAQTDYRYANAAQTKNTLNMINGMTEPNGAIDIASRAANKLPKMNSKTANQVFNIAKTEFGDSALTDFHTAMLGLADEYSKVMGGGVSSDTGRQQALDILKENYSKGQLAGAVQIMKSDIAARKKAIIGKNRYLLQEYGDEQGGTGQGAQADPFATFGGKKR